MSLNNATDSVRSLTSALETQKEASDGLLRSFGELANGTGEASKKWTAFSRVLSGSGLWKLQNYMRSLGQVLDFYYKKQDRAFEETQKSIRSVGKVQQELQKVADVQKDLNDASLSFKDLSDSIEEVADAYAMADAAGMEQQKAQEFALNRTIKQYSDMHDVLLETKKRYGSEVKLLLKEEEKQTQLAAERETATKLLKQEELLRESFSAKQLEARQAAGRTGFGRQAGGGFRQTKEGRRMLNQIRDLAKERRIDAAKSIGAGIKNSPLFKFLTLGLFSPRGQQPIFKMIRVVVSGVKAFRKIPFGKVMKMASKYALLGVMFLIQAFVIFSLFRTLVKDAEVIKTLVDGAKEIFEGLAVIASGVFDIFNAFFGSGSIDERFVTLITGIAKIFGGLGAIIFTVMKGIVKLAFGLLVGLLSIYVKAILVLTSGAFWANVFEKLKAKFLSLGEGIVEKIKTFFTRNVMGFFKRIVNTIIKGINAVSPFADIPQLATGGLIDKGGLAIVGERGPELVNLPTGAKVNPNGSRGSTTINVSVNGRMGASDSELRDIAKKIGRMVNTEINRTTSSSTNVRY
tara:strand:- start:15324 stop:17045 length:1722 start_codon:yes stop_codon:yes gene_type:complete